VKKKDRKSGKIERTSTITLQKNKKTIVGFFGVVNFPVGTIKNLIPTPLDGKRKKKIPLSKKKEAGEEG